MRIQEFTKRIVDGTVTKKIGDRNLAEWQARWDELREHLDALLVAFSGGR